ncbi:hypothetical protein [Infirmifilum sp.]|uniref:hypothetical protein n=1 Tax=Infirmifilum sp. TaxID=2856575 RepID=UPI003D14D487
MIETTMLLSRMHHPKTVHVAVKWLSTLVDVLDLLACWPVRGTASGLLAENSCPQLGQTTLILR